MTRIVLVNPNTDSATTSAMMAIARTVLPADVVIEGMTVSSGRLLIVDDDGLAIAARAVVELEERLRAAAPDGVIISAFGDPGLGGLRSLLTQPVTGIAEAGMAEAAVGGRPFAVVTTTPSLRNAIAATATRYGHEPLFRGTVTTPGQPATLMADPERLVAALFEACAEAIREWGAQAIVVGGGPLAHAAMALAEVIAVPVIQPVPAAVRLAWRRAVLKTSESLIERS